MAELGLYKTNPVSEWVLRNILSHMVTKAARARNASATLENMRRSMDESHVDRTACMPIAPHVTFEDLLKAQQIDPGVIPFTTVDFTRQYDFTAALREDVARGAKGLKLHPIIQKEPLTSERTFSVVEAFAPHDLPIMLHTGVQSYYLGAEENVNQNPAYGELQDAKPLVAAFPKVAFIAGHAGMFQYKEAMELLAKFKNVYVDISFQPPEKIRELIKAFGPERVMYGSDYPWGERKAAIASTKKACKGDKAIENLLYYLNAAKLLKLTL